MSSSDSNDSLEKSKAPLPDETFVTAPSAREEWSLDDDYNWYFDGDPSSGDVIASVGSVGPTGGDSDDASIVRLEGHRTGPRLIVEIISLQELEKLEPQVLSMGILVPLAQSVAFGTSLDVCFLFPSVRAEIWYVGRVVYVSPAGTAIELQTSAEAKGHWLRASTAFKGSTPFPGRPGASPKSEPPRLRRVPPEPSSPSGVRRKRSIRTIPIDARKVVREVHDADMEPSPPTRPTAFGNRAESADSESRSVRSDGIRKARSRPTRRSGSRPGVASDASGSQIAPIGPEQSSRGTVARSRSAQHARPSPSRSRPLTGRTRPVGSKAPTPPKTAPSALRNAVNAPQSNAGRPKGVVAIPPGFYGPRFGAELTLRLERLSERNHFGLFGLHWSAYPERIEGAYRREKALFDPANVPNDLLAHKGKEISRLLDAYDAAWETLRWRASRRAHRAVIVEEGAVKNAIDHYMEKGELASMRGNEEEARDCLLRVMDLDPKDSKATRLLQEMGLGEGPA